jgi:predicted  nucleic acid-binding Zn-ribbon protein
MNLEFIGNSWYAIRGFISRIIPNLKVKWSNFSNCLPKVMARSSYKRLLNQLDKSDKRYEDLFDEMKKLLKISESIKDDLSKSIAQNGKLEEDLKKLRSELSKYKDDAVQFRAKSDVLSHALNDTRRSLIHMTELRDKYYLKLVENGIKVGL